MPSTVHHRIELLWFIGRQKSFLAISASQASQEVQWLRLFPSTEGDVGSIPGWGLHALSLSQKKKAGRGGIGHSRSLILSRYLSKDFFSD